MKTKFVIAIAKLEGGGLLFESKFIEVPASLIYKKEKSYFLEIGKLHISEEYKKRGSKIRILLSVYREFRNQTRVRSLEGIFKI